MLWLSHFFICDFSFYSMGGHNRGQIGNFMQKLLISCQLDPPGLNAPISDYGGYLFSHVLKLVPKCSSPQALQDDHFQFWCCLWIFWITSCSAILPSTRLVEKKIICTLRGFQQTPIGIAINTDGEANLLNEHNLPTHFGWPLQGSLSM